MGIKLSEVLEGLQQDEDLRKIAAVGGSTDMSSEVARTQGGTKEDQKAQIATKLMEIAGAEVQSAATAGSTPTNIVARPPAGEKVTPEAVHVASAQEMGDVVGVALEKLDEEGRKVASKAIIEKIAAMGVWKSAADIKDIKTAAPKSGEDWDAAGRLMARGYHDESLKLAEADVKAIEDGEKAEAAKVAAEKAASEKTAAAKTGLTPEDEKFLKDICG